jgi:hypothetical protein
MVRVRSGRIARLVLALCVSGIAAASSASAAPRVTLELSDPPGAGTGGFSIIAMDDQGGVDNPVAVTARLEVIRGGAVLVSASATGSGGATVRSTLELSPGDVINVYTSSAADPAVPARRYTFDGQLDPTVACLGATTVSGSQPANRDTPGPYVELAGPGGSAVGVVEAFPVAFRATFSRTLAPGDWVFVYLNANTPSGGPGALLKVARPAVRCPASGPPELPSQPPFSYPQPSPPAAGSDLAPPSMSLAGVPRSARASRNGVVALTLGKVTERVTGRLTLRTAKRLKISPRKVITLATRSFSGAEDKTITVKVRLSATNRRLLKKLRSVRVKATVTLKDAVGNRSVRTHRFTLKAPRSRG